MRWRALSGGDHRSTLTPSSTNRLPPRNSLNSLSHDDTTVGNSVEVTDWTSPASSTQYHLRAPLRNIQLNDGRDANTRGNGFGLDGVAADGQTPNGLFNENAQVLRQSSPSRLTVGALPSPVRNWQSLCEHAVPSACKSVCMTRVCVGRFLFRRVGCVGHLS